MDESKSQESANDAKKPGAVVAFDPLSDLHDHVVIDAVATEEAAKDKRTEKAEAAPTVAEARHRTRAFWPAAVAAAVVLGVGGGFAGGVHLSHRSNEARELAKTAHELHTRLGALEKRAAEEASRPRVAVAAIAALKAEMEKSKVSAAAQSTQLGARLDKIDRDAAARFDKIEKTLASRDTTASIRALPTPPVAPAPAAASQNATTVAPATTPTPPVKDHEPVKASVKPVEKPKVPMGGWVLRDVRDGIALVEGLSGMREVGPGDYLPGAGRVQRLERRSGQWVLVTSAGIVDQEAY